MTSSRRGGVVLAAVVILLLGDLEPETPESGPHHTYVKSYDTWVLDGDDLVLVLPSERSGPVGAGLIRPHIPLTALPSVPCRA